MSESRHCDDYIDDFDQPICLRWFLLINRMPAIDKLVADEAGCKPKLFAIYDNKKVRVVMASRLGDVGITTNLNTENGYEHRMPISELTDFSDKP